MDKKIYKKKLEEWTNLGHDVFIEYFNDGEFMIFAEKKTPEDIQIHVTFKDTSIGVDYGYAKFKKLVKSLNQALFQINKERKKIK